MTSLQSVHWFRYHHYSNSAKFFWIEKQLKLNKVTLVKQYVYGTDHILGIVIDNIVHIHVLTQDGVCKRIMNKIIYEYNIEVVDYEFINIDGINVIVCAIYDDYVYLVSETNSHCNISKLNSLYNRVKECYIVNENIKAIEL